MNIEELTKQLIDHESERLFPYRCTAGKLTIGIGRNISDKGISKAESRFMLQNDIKECYEDLQPLFVYFDLLPESIQHVLIDMRFQLGGAGFRKFRKMITAVNNHNQEEMIKQMIDSNWYKQVPNRAKHLIKMIREG